MAFPPHEFIHVGAQRGLVYPFHAFKPGFHPVPIGLNVMHVDPCGRISEGNGVVDSLVLSHIREVLYSMICSPLITPHYASWTNMLLN